MLFTLKNQFLKEEDNMFHDLIAAQSTVMCISFNENKSAYTMI